MKLQIVHLLIVVFATIEVTYAQTAFIDSATNNKNYGSIERNIGFGKQKETYITSSIAFTRGIDLRKRFTNSIGNTLNAELAGLTVTPSGHEPGTNFPTLNIRGMNTFGFSTAPLIIVDGFLADYTQLVPEEIEEISVLKDAAATAIYGMRAANGVVLVTTKKGIISPLAVTFNAQYGIQQATALPNFLSSYDYATLYNEALLNDGKPALYTQADLNHYKDGTDPVFHPSVNWYNELFRKNAPLSNYSLNFTGGDSTVKYFALLNSISSEGLYKNFGDDYVESSNSKYNRYNFRANVSVSLSKRMSAQLILGASVEDKQNPGDLTYNTNLTLIDRLPPNAFSVVNTNGSFGGNLTYPGNPLADVTSTGFSTSNSTTLQSSLAFTNSLDMITDGLSARVAVAFNSYYLGVSGKRKSYQRFSVSPGSSGTPVYSTAFGQKTSLNPEEILKTQTRNYSIQFFLNYSRVFGKHSFTGMLMCNSDNSNLDRKYPNTDAANQLFPYKANMGGTRLTYIYNEKYITEFSSSYMGTENFPADSRYGFFPAASIGWIVSRERILNTSKAVNFLKLRASYGLVGNENIGGQRFAFTQLFTFISPYFLGTGNTPVNALGEGRRANPNVTWEKERKFNVGIDVNFLRSFEMTVDLFRNKRHDIPSPANVAIPTFLGYNGSSDLNLGKVKNEGIEASLNYNANVGKAFQFFIQGVVSYSKNNVTYNGEAFQLNSNLYRAGYDVAQPFGLKALGFFQSDAEIASSAKPLGIVLKSGDIKYEDIGGADGHPDGLIDDNDFTAIGKSFLPQLWAGVHCGGSYKGFDLDLFFQGVTNVTSYLKDYRYYAFQDNGQINEIALSRWTPQTASSASYPRLSADNNQNNYRFSSFWQRDGSFIKLRTAEVGYNFSENLIQRMRLSHARIFANGTNLFSLDKIENADPEALYGYPSIRTFSFGLKVSL